MGRYDWYRKTTWTEQDRSEFWLRLNRSRNDFNKAQYLRIQALTLEETGVEANIHASMELLDGRLADYPDIDWDTASCSG